MFDLMGLLTCFAEVAFMQGASQYGTCSCPGVAQTPEHGNGRGKGNAASTPLRSPHHPSGPQVAQPLGRQALEAQGALFISLIPPPPPPRPDDSRQGSTHALPLALVSLPRSHIKVHGAISNSWTSPLPSRLKARLCP